MKSVIINATEREDLGSKFARKLRKEGNVPCVVYGGDKPLHFYAPVLAFRDLVYTAEAVKASIVLGENAAMDAIMQDIQFHPVTDQIMHIDFIQLIAKKPVTMEIPVNLNGVARGVLNGGRLSHILRKLSIRAIPANLPDSIEIDITNLRIGKSIRVSELQTGDFEILNLQNAVVCGVLKARGAEEDEEEEEAEGEEGAEGAEGAEGTPEAAAE